MKEMEEKWQRKWEEVRIFEANPSEKRKFFLTAAFPYPNSPQHIGHARTYTTTDVYARYMRLKGYNVLFPMGFHVTGTPILAMAKRIKEGDEQILDIFENIYKIPRDVASKLTEPLLLVNYFSDEIEKGMKEMGFSIDWRRKFYTNNTAFNKFIQWQFKKLKEKGLLTQGAHPVPWCPNCNNAVGAHDTQADIDPEIDEYVLIKFRFKDGYILTATFRPETVYGVTNIWINPDAEYVKVVCNNEIYYVSREAAEKMKLQGMNIIIQGRFFGKELLNEKTFNNITEEWVPIFPASFVDPKNGSGVVMSVPAHAPYDYLALRDYGADIKLKSVLRIDGYGNFPAKEIVEKMNIKNQLDIRAEEATKEIYKKEAHTGYMIVGKYVGKRVIEAKEKIKEDLLNEKNALTLFEIINGPIYCRCRAQCVVRIVENQWFINYGNEEWKESARECLKNMEIVPKKLLGEYKYTIEWLKEKACVRASGLGTPFPYEPTQVIESLSDSTIYMAFYTISHKLKESDAIDENFDYIFLGKGKANEKIEELRKEFLYWYPLDSRHSGADLIHNHLTFFIFNHTAIFQKPFWPKKIITNGFVLMDGKKMSKSMGNILPLREAVKKYGADVVRFSVVSGADLSQDSDFNQAMVEGVISRMKFLLGLVERIVLMEEKEREQIDLWLISKIHKKIKRYEESFENFELRSITQEIFYDAINELKWYSKRGEENKIILKEYFENLVILISPFLPHLAEEMWERLGKKGFVSITDFPKVDENKINERVEKGEEVIIQIKEDIEKILEIVEKKPKKIHLFVASEWKRCLYKIAYEKKKFEICIKESMEVEEIKKHGKEVPKILKIFIKDVNKLSEIVLTEEEELRILKGAENFFSKEFSAEVIVLKEDETKIEKAKQSLPFKPSIFIEFYE